MPWREVLLTGLGTAVAFVVLGWVTQLHRGRASLASLEEMVLLGVVTWRSSASQSTVLNAVFQWVPRSVPPGPPSARWCSPPGAGPRGAGSESAATSRYGAGGGAKVLLVGGGDAGRELISSMSRDPQRQWQPVGILDDDPLKRRRRIRGVPVLGRADDLPRVAEETGADSVVIAIPSADADHREPDPTAGDGGGRRRQGAPVERPSCSPTTSGSATSATST